MNTSRGMLVGIGIVALLLIGGFILYSNSTQNLISASPTPTPTPTPSPSPSPS